MKKFPQFVGLHKKYKDKGLVCVSLAVESKKDKALEFLKKEKAEFDNYLIPIADDDTEMIKLYESWGFPSIPAVILFDRTGKRVKVFQEEHGIEDVEAEVKKLLAAD